MYICLFICQTEFYHTSIDIPIKGLVLMTTSIYNNANTDMTMYSVLYLIVLLFCYMLACFEKYPDFRLFVIACMFIKF